MTLTEVSPRPTVTPDATLELDELSALTRSIAARPELWRPLVRFDQGERWWTRLESPAGTDVWLLSWLTSQGTELHDHGDSAAALTVVAGTLTELRPDADGRLVPREVTAGGTQTVEIGGLHDVVNTHSEPSVSIHAYSPRLTRMTYYARVDGHIVPTRTLATTEPETNA